MTANYLLAKVTDAEISEVFAGRHAKIDVPWPAPNFSLRLPPGDIGVLCRGPRRPRDLAQPLALVVEREQQRRLFGRFAQVRPEFSPLSAWCHILSPRRFEIFQSVEILADLSGYEAAWTGLIIAEALLLTGRPIAQEKIAACFATQSFAVARTKSLWGSYATKEALEGYDTAQHLFGTGHRTLRVRSALMPIWGVLSSLNTPEQPSTGGLTEIVRALEALSGARDHGDADEFHRITGALRHVVPEVELFSAFNDLSPEKRVHLFDRLIQLLDQRKEDDPVRRQALTFLAGYVATVAAGGGPSLSLTLPHRENYPEILIWAYVLGGIGEHCVWTSSFDGLGRLVARELMRSFRLDDAPSADFAIDEADVLIDPQLSDPLVHLRIKQSRVLTVSILPGVNIFVPISPDMAQDVRGPAEDRGEPSDAPADPMAVLASAMWPYFQTLMEHRDYSGDARNSSSGRSKRSRSKREGTQSKLPLR